MINVPSKGPNFKYFAMLLVTLCCMTAYSRKITDSRRSPLVTKVFPVNANGLPTDFVRKAAKTYNKKHTTLNTNYRHKMQKGLFICNLKDLFYLVELIPKISFKIRML